jgi:hypothetical protein
VRHQNFHGVSKDKEKWRLWESCTKDRNISTSNGLYFEKDMCFVSIGASTHEVKDIANERVGHFTKPITYS